MSFCPYGEDPRQKGTGCLREEGHAGAHMVMEANPEDPDYTETEQN